MISHHDSKNNTYTFERESWKEIFRILVSGKLLLYGDKKGMDILLKRFIKTHDLINIDISVFWKWYLFPFIKTGLWIKRKWFRLGGYFYKQKLLGRYKEGERVSWFWLKYLTYKK